MTTVASEPQVVKKKVDYMKPYKAKVYMERREFLNASLAMQARAALRVANGTYRCENTCAMADCNQTIHLEFPISSSDSEWNQKTLVKARLLRDLLIEFVAGLEAQARDMETVIAQRKADGTLSPKTDDDSLSYYE